MTNEDWTNLLGSANSAIAQVGSAVVGATADKATREYNKEQADIQRKWAEEQADKANAWNYERWIEANEYNSPSQQVQRLRDAGLNPLFYGLDGNSSGAMEGAVQPLGYERSNATPFVNPIATGLNAASQIAQTKLAIASAGKAENEGDLASEKAISESLLRDRQYDFLGVQIDLGKSEVKVNDMQVRKYASDIHSIEKQVEKMDVDIIEAYSRMDVAQRSQKLAEDSFEFSRALSTANLSLREKEVAVQWYNANTQRLVGEADIELKEGQKAYVALEGEQVKAVTATENALRPGKVERQDIENKTAVREYKWMPVEKTIKAVGTAAGIAGGIMLGSGKLAGAAKAASAAAPLSKGSYTTLYGPDGNPVARNTW